ncbi:MAG TPA: indole-3-glycerol phosphate synthase TrpC [Drouetiella sp.]
MPTKLDEIVENKKLEVAARIQSRSLDSFRDKVVNANHEFAAALRQPGVNLICEVKPKSPSAGVLRGAVNVDDILKSYNKHARAVSVLTDEKYFGGSLELLAEISEKSQLPTLCKDFVIDVYQCYEARECGAKAVLLIVKILNDEQLQTLYACIQNLGMDAIVEVQTEDEMQRALSIKPSIIMINNRNLSTFEMDLGTTERLAARVPSDTILISASGILEKSDMERLLPVCSNFLIGSALMKSDNMEELMAELANMSVPARSK